MIARILLPLILLCGLAVPLSAQDKVEVVDSWTNPDGTWYCIFSDGDWGYLTPDGKMYIDSRDGHLTASA